MSVKTFYRVGLLTAQSDDDLIVEGWDAAEREAERRATSPAALDQVPEQPFGIWEWTDDGNATLDGIWFAGTVFTP